jgi:hypothetical protein
MQIPKIKIRIFIQAFTVALKRKDFCKASEEEIFKQGVPMHITLQLKCAGVSFRRNCDFCSVCFVIAVLKALR